jgi:aspartate aminotransferase
VVSDSPYSEQGYEEYPPCFLQVPGAKDVGIEFFSFSKSYNMTGWRLGWTIAPKEFSKKLGALQSQSNSHTTSFVQWAAITAAKLPPTILQSMVSEFDTRRQYCMKRLDALSDYLTYTRPTGAFYFFINMSKFLVPRKMSDLEFAKTLLEKEYLGVVPGSSFGKENCMRISYATSLKNLETAFNRLETFLKTH